MASIPPKYTREIGNQGILAGPWGMGRMFQTAFDESIELTWPNSISNYSRMRRSDAMVKAGLRAITLPILRTPFFIEANGARDEVVEFVAQDLVLPIAGSDEAVDLPRRAGRFTFAHHLKEALSYLAMGHSVFESVYTIKDGRAHLRKLGLRPAETISAWGIAEDGGLHWVEQDPVDATHPKPVRIPIERLVIYVHEKEGADWTGNSILRSAFMNWVLKNRIYKLRGIVLERASGLPLYRASEMAGEEEMDKGEKMATDLRSGEFAGGAIPSGANLGYEGFSGSLPDHLADINHHDLAISRSLLSQFLMLGGETQTGSRALGEAFIGFFEMALQGVLEEIADVATAHVIEDLVDLNFGEGERAPVLRPGDIGGTPEVLADSVAQLINVGAITPDEELENWIRRAMRLPLRTEATPPIPNPNEPVDEEEPLDEELPEDEGFGRGGNPLGRSDFHLPGRHNQKTHGNETPTPDIEIVSDRDLPDDAKQRLSGALRYLFSHEGTPGLTMPRRVEVRSGDDQAEPMAWTDPKQPLTLNISPEAGQGLVEPDDALFQGNKLVADDLGEVLVHEAAHLYDFNELKLERGTVTFADPRLDAALGEVGWLDKDGDWDLEKIQANISRYAYSSNELWPEAMTLVATGRATDEVRRFVSHLLANGKRSEFHLPGRHNQESHGNEDAAPDVPSAGAVPMTEALAKEIFEGEFLGGKLHTEVELVREESPGSLYAGQQTVKGKIKDEHGSVVGNFHRRFDPYTKTLAHEELGVAPRFQGKGIASAFNAKAEEEYIRMGYERITVHASRDVGGYAWAARGFDFFGYPGQPGRPDPSVLVKMEELLKSRTLDPHSETYQELDDLWLRSGVNSANPPSAFEISRLGYKDAHKDENGKTTWLGKKLMMGTAWLGYKCLTEKCAEAA